MGIGAANRVRSKKRRGVLCGRGLSSDSWFRIFHHDGLWRLSVQDLGFEFVIIIAAPKLFVINILC